jgi:D-alanine-D-alanine ligase
VEQANAVLLLANDFGDEADASRKSAEAVAASLRRSHEVILHVLRAKDWIAQLAEMRGATVAFLATHGGIGENGTVHVYLEAMKVAHTHSVSRACAVLSDKHTAKLMYRGLGLRTPSWMYRGVTEGLHEPRLWVRKPIDGGSKRELSMVSEVTPLGKWIYEEPIQGTHEVSLVVLGSSSPVALAPIVRQRDLPNLGVLTECDDSLDPATLAYCRDAALRVHRGLGCSGVTKSDFLVDSKGDAWIIETDAHPGLAPLQATAMAAERSGIPYGELVEAILQDTV